MHLADRLRYLLRIDNAFPPQLPHRGVERGGRLSDESPKTWIGKAMSLCAVARQPVEISRKPASMGLGRSPEKKSTAGQLGSPINTDNFRQPLALVVVIGPARKSSGLLNGQDHLQLLT